MVVHQRHYFKSSVAVCWRQFISSIWPKSMLLKHTKLPLQPVADPLSPMIEFRTQTDIKANLYKRVAFSWWSVWGDRRKASHWGHMPLCQFEFEILSLETMGPLRVVEAIKSMDLGLIEEINRRQLTCSYKTLEIKSLEDQKRAKKNKK